MKEINSEEHKRLHEVLSLPSTPLHPTLIFKRAKKNYILEVGMDFRGCRRANKLESLYRQLHSLVTKSESTKENVHAPTKT